MHARRHRRATEPRAVATPQVRAPRGTARAARDTGDARPPPDPEVGGGLCSPEQIRTAVTALRGRRPRPLDDGAGNAVGLLAVHVRRVAFGSLGGEDSNPQIQDQNLLCYRLHHPRMGEPILAWRLSGVRSDAIAGCNEAGEASARVRAGASSRTAAGPPRALRPRRRAPACPCGLLMPSASTRRPNVGRLDRPFAGLQVRDRPRRARRPAVPSSPAPSPTRRHRR